MFRRDLALSGSGVFVARVIDSAQGHRTTRGGMSTLRRKMSTVAIAVLLAMLSSLAVVTADAQRAEANWFTNALKSVFCSNTAFFNAPQPWANGLTAMGMANGGLGTAALAHGNALFGGDSTFLDERRTAYEKYGMAGTNWTVYAGERKDNMVTSNSHPRAEIGDAKPNEDTGIVDLRAKQAEGCVPVVGIIGTATANSIFGITKFVTSVGGWIMSHAYSPTFINGLNDKAAVVITGEDGRPGLRDTLYFEFLNLVLVLGAIYLFSVGIVKRQSLQAATSAIWMVGAVIVGSIFTYNPAFLSNMTESIITEVNSAILVGMPMNKSGGENICDSDVRRSDGRGANADSHRERARIIRGANCTFWQTFVYTPWSIGQWGTAPGSLDATKVNEAQKDQSAGGNLPPVFSLEPEVDLGGGTRVYNWALWQVEQQTITPDIMGLSKNSLAEQGKRIFNWYLLADFTGAPGGYQGMFNDWSGNNAGERIMVATASLVAAVSALVIVTSLSMTMIAYAIGNSLLMFMAIFFFLAGAHPGLGRRLAMKWAEMFVSTVLKRIILAALLAAVLAFYSALIGDATNDWGVSVIAIIALSVAVMIYRKEMLNSLGEVNFGGANFPTENPAKKAAATVKGVAAGTVMGAGASAVGAVRVGRAAAAAPALQGASRRARIAAATKAASRTVGRGAMRGATTSATHVGGFMSNPAVVAAQKGFEGSSSEANRIYNQYEREEKEAQKEQEKAAQEQEKAAQAEIARERAEQDAQRQEESKRKKAAARLNPATVAQERKEAERNARRYRTDYARLHNDKLWRDNFQKTYGFFPPDPKRYDFGGYGLTLDEIRGKVDSSEYMPRPRQQENRNTGEQLPGHDSGDTDTDGPPPSGSGSGGGPLPGGGTPPSTGGAGGTGGSRPQPPAPTAPAAPAAPAPQQPPAAPPVQQPQPRRARPQPPANGNQTPPRRSGGGGGGRRSRPSRPRNN